MLPVVEQVLDQVRDAWRFRWYAIGIAWIVCVVGWLVVLTMPDVYQAKARIYVDTRTALTQTVEGLAFEQNIEAQLNFVRQNLLGRPALERVARETQLDRGVTTAREREALVETLRKRINIETGPTRRNATDSIYTIAYTDHSRAKSLEVVDRLLNTFVEDTLGGKREGSVEAQRFLEAQISEYEARLAEAETRLADFKRKNVGLVPGDQGDYFARLQAEVDNLRKLKEQLSIATSRRAELATQLRGESAVLAASAAQSSRDAAGGDTGGRLQEARARLDELLLRFTDKHPDVIALRETIAQLEERQKNEIAALQRGDLRAALASGVGASPVYQQIQLQINQTDVEIAALQRQSADSDNRIAELRKLVDTVPEVEAEFARLNRDYDVTKQAYNRLVDRLEKARISEQAEETGSVRFEIIDPPAAPFEPVSPKRTMLLLGVLAAALGAGAGLAYVMNMLRPVFNTSKSLAEFTGLPVLGAVSVTALEQLQLQKRMSLIRFSTAGALLGIAFLMVLLLQQPGTRFIQRLIG
ncbi:XrtA system polysaccharide chain length determinant [Peristeroidobacter agariperforans]|uniref:XrtA system polysaccharide chain length determinant n=1 Tax=Peristeroidobacter agariperforans TaxID=268404 RepID=UPI00101D707B|nr:XrtA system polysaccharide chain length determinant [Peristeroidobacter agariperforans]